MQIMFIIWSTWCSEILEQLICDPQNIITPITFLTHKHVIMSLIIRTDYESGKIYSSMIINIYMVVLSMVSISTS